MLLRNRKRWLFGMIASAFLITAIQASSAAAQGIKIKVGRTVGGSGFHIPSYVAMDKGFFKGEGLDAAFIATTGGVLVRAAIAKEIEFVPIRPVAPRRYSRGRRSFFLSDNR
jgi:ABC-type nitrate/sulfonate/bicarbonate transport system substrate-binding protein